MGNGLYSPRPSCHEPFLSGAARETPLHSAPAPGIFSPMEKRNRRTTSLACVRLDRRMNQPGASDPGPIREQMLQRLDIRR
jgi:hypothetical protein